VRVGLLTSARWTGQALATAESLRKSSVGLGALFGLSEVVPRSAAARVARRLRRRAAAALGRPGAGAAPVSARRYARRHGIAYWPVPHPHHRATVRALRDSGVDIVVAMGAGILRSALLDLPGVTFVNAHAGRLPGYAGMNVVEWAVFQGDPIYGTVHRIEPGIDTGAILLEAPLDLGRPGSVEELRASAFSGAWGLLQPALEGLAEGRLGFRAQPDGARRVQWFRMHPELVKTVERRLRDGSFFQGQESATRRT
jgi:methionyl-tRNA formyltransferase